MLAASEERDIELELTEDEKNSFKIKLKSNEVFEFSIYSRILAWILADIKEEEVIYCHTKNISSL